MKIIIVCVGKLKEDFWVSACAEYIKRLRPYVTLEVREVADVDPAKAGGVEGVRVKEGAAILAQCPEQSPCILLDLGGSQRSSEAFSEHIQGFGLHGQSTITFIIGGSYGVSKEVRDRANELLSLGEMTFPHNMVRVILLEQIYRAFKIARNEPYHK